MGRQAANNRTTLTYNCLMQRCVCIFRFLHAKAKKKPSYRDLSQLVGCQPPPAFFYIEHSISEQSHKSATTRSCFALKCVHIYTAYIEVRWLKTSFDRRLFVRKTKRTAFSHRVIYTLCVYNFGCCCCCDFLYDSTIQRLAYGQIVNNLFYWQRFCANRRIRYMNMGYWFKSLNMLQDMFTF